MTSEERQAHHRAVLIALCEAIPHHFPIYDWTTTMTPEEPKIIVLMPTNELDQPHVPSMKQFCMVCGEECWMSNHAYEYWEREGFSAQVMCVVCAINLPDPPERVEPIPGSTTKIPLNKLHALLRKLYTNPSKET